MKKLSVSKILFVVFTVVFIQCTAYAADKNNVLKKVTWEESGESVTVNIITSRKLEYKPEAFRITKYSSAISLQETDYPKKRTVISPKNSQKLQNITIEYKPYNAKKNSGYTRIIVTTKDAAKTKIIVVTKVDFVPWIILSAVAGIIGLLILLRFVFFGFCKKIKTFICKYKIAIVPNENASSGLSDSAKEFIREIQNEKTVTISDEVENNAIFAETDILNLPNETVNENLFPSSNDVVDDILNNEEAITQITNTIETENKAIENILDVINDKNLSNDIAEKDTDSNVITDMEEFAMLFENDETIEINKDEQNEQISIDAAELTDDDFSDNRDDTSDDEVLAENIETDNEIKAEEIGANEIAEDNEDEDDEDNEDDDFEIIDEVAIDDETHVYLIERDEEYDLIGVVGENMNIIESFEPNEENRKFKFKLNEIRDDGKVYIAKVGHWKALVLVSESGMENILTLS